MNQQINLYHPIFRREPKRFSAAAMAQASAALLLGVVLMAVYLGWQVSILRTAVAQMHARQLAAAAHLESITRRLAAGQDEVAELKQELASRERLALALVQATFGDGKGYSAYLVGFARADVPGLWLTAFDVVGSGERIDISGRAVGRLLVPRYLERLEVQPALRGQAFRVFEMRSAKGGGLYDFSVGSGEGGKP